jgi:hypothetical protein
MIIQPYHVKLRTTNEQCQTLRVEAIKPWRIDKFSAANRNVSFIIISYIIAS